MHPSQQQQHQQTHRHQHQLVIATRLHLGKASSPPSTEALQQTVQQFFDFCRQQQLPSNLVLRQAIIAVDAAPKYPHYDLVHAVKSACRHAVTTTNQLASSRDDDWNHLLHVLPVTPWGMFVPALNACLVHAMTPSSSHDDTTTAADCILFVSAESCSASSPESQHVVSSLYQHLDMDNTLVCGAVLAGHDYYYDDNPTTNDHANDANAVEAASACHQESHPNENHPQDTATMVRSGRKLPLTGRTTPWNTLALWNLKKLALTGFLLLSDGLLDPEAYGVEEVPAIATLQLLLGPHQALAKLIAVPGVTWKVDFDQDAQRQTWQEEKMKSKVTRAQRQLELLLPTTASEPEVQHSSSPSAAEAAVSWVYHY